MTNKEIYKRAFKRYLEKRKLYDQYITLWHNPDSFAFRSEMEDTYPTVNEFWNNRRPALWIDYAFNWGSSESICWEEVSYQWEDIVYSYGELGKPESAWKSLIDFMQYFIPTEMNKNTKTL